MEKLVLVAGMLLLVACSPEKVARGIADLEPFATLDVPVGISAAELRDRRPSVVVAPYEGYRERIGGLQAYYLMDGSYTETQEPASFRRVEAIEIRGMDASFSQWERTLEQYRAHLGQPRCSRLAAPKFSAQLAEWAVEGSVVSLVLSTSTAAYNKDRPTSELVVRVGEPLPYLANVQVDEADCADLGRR